jgi:Xaa-Pro aminopeptidase
VNRSQLPLREQAALRDAWLIERLDVVVPRIMRRAGIDCWIVAGREYNEDPVLSTMLPATWMSARRRTIVCFTDFGRRRIALSRYAVGEAFPSGWDPVAEPDQWAALAALLADKKPARIAINRSDVFSLGDGLSASENAAMVTALSTDQQTRLCSGVDLAVGWLETRIPAEVAAHREACAAAHELLRRALSREAITPGTTTTEDVGWWLRQEVGDAGYGTWFHPAVSTQASGDTGSGSFAATSPDRSIMPGDLVHIDFGITHLGLHTDQQQHAYVLQPEEVDAPVGLRDAIAGGNAAQDLLMDEMRIGRTGNQVLEEARKRAQASGIEATFYTHAIGLHGHAAGPTIGLWDQQGGVPGVGDYPLHPDTAYSIELSITARVPEWGGELVRVMLEEDAFLDSETIDFLDGRQQQLWLV